MKIIIIILSIVTTVLIFIGISNHSTIKELKIESQVVKNKYVVCYLNSFYDVTGNSHNDGKSITHDLKMEETILAEVVKMEWKYQRENGLIYISFGGSRLASIDDKKNIKWDNAQLGNLWGPTGLSADGNTEIFR